MIYNYLIQCACLFLLVDVVFLSSVFVEVVEDDGSVNTYYEPYNFDPLESSVPFSHRYQEDHVFRSTRSVDEDDDSDEGIDHCDKYLVANKSDSRLALVRRIGETLRLPCHFCGDAPEKIKAPHIWYRYIHQKLDDKIEWRAVEVEMDMHDDDHMNRVFQESDHTLVIRNVKITDKGSYFCMEYDPHRNVDKAFIVPSSSSKAISAVAMASVWKNTSKSHEDVEFIYHFDVQLTMKTALVSASGIGYPRPSKPHVNRTQNWQTMSVWSDWDECNTCGGNGERRRRGTCMVSVIDPDKPVTNPYMASVLKLYPGGAACHSSLFVHLGSTFDEIPEEVEVAKCDMKCDHLNRPGSDYEQNMSKNVSTVVRREAGEADDEEAQKIRFVGRGFKRRNVIISEHDRLELTCPSATIDTPLQWRKDSKLLQSIDLAAETDGRIQIDAYKAIQIHNVLMSDTGKYICYDPDHVRIQYTLMVQYTVRPLKPDSHTVYLYISYIANFVIFLMISIFRILYRTCGSTTMKKKKRKPKIIQSDSNSDIGSAKNLATPRVSRWSMSPSKAEHISIVSEKRNSMQ